MAEKLDRRKYIIQKEVTNVFFSEIILIIDQDIFLEIARLLNPEKSNAL